MRKLITILFIIALGVVTAAVIGDWQGANAALINNKLEYVQTVCDIAHAQVNGTSESECGRVQDETGTEYLCNASASQCWVEVK